MTSLQRRIFACLLALSGAGCSVSADVTGYVGSLDQVYRGKSTGFSDHSGNIQMTSATGVRCAGDYVWWSAGGQGNLICDDGKTARVRFTRLSMSSGYGSGVTSDGEPLQFTFGLNETEAKKYISLPAGRAVLRGDSSGTGFFIDAQGTLLTNQHVVDGCKSITATSLDGIQSDAQVLSVDTRNDLALVRTSRTGTHYARLRLVESARLGNKSSCSAFRSRTSCRPAAT